MIRLVIFLRGINVNGVKIKMKALKKMFEELNYSNIITVSASGNVIVDANDELTMIEHQHLIEEALAKQFKYEAFTVVIPKEAFLSLLEQVTCSKRNDQFNYHVLLSNTPSIFSELFSLFSSLAKGNGEQVIIKGHTCLWIVKKGETLKTPFGKRVLGDKKYKNLITTRNITTLEKIKAKL